MKITIHFPDGHKKEYTLQEVPKTLAEFRLTYCQRNFIPTQKREVPSYYPCLHPGCNGIGRIYDPNDPPDPIEGNKCRNRITCPTCKGSGTSNKKDFTAFYKKEKAQAQTRRNQQKERAKTLQAALNKLTAEEFKLIQNHSQTFSSL